MWKYMVKKHIELIMTSNSKQQKQQLILVV